MCAMALKSWNFNASPTDNSSGFHMRSRRDDSSLLQSQSLASGGSTTESAEDDTLHYFRKLLKESRIDEDYEDYMRDCRRNKSASPLRPLADSITGRLLNSLWPRSLASVPPEVEEHRANRLPWLIAASPNGRRLALLKRRQLELYSLKKGLEEALVVIATPPDPHCQWRLLRWSANSQCIAVANSDGGVLVLTVRGQKLCELLPIQVTDNPVGCPLAFLMLESGGSSGSRREATAGSVIVLFTVSMSGLLKQFLLDLQQPPQQQQQQPEPPQCLSSYNLRDRVAGQTVFCGCYDPISGTLALGSTTMRHSPTLSAPLQHGIQLWRRISEFPFIKASLALEEDIVELRRSRRLLSSALLRHRSRTDSVTAMALSPDASKLAAAYTYGCVSVWTFPAGNLISTFSLADQCLSSVRSPLLARARVLGVPRRLYPGKPDEQPSGVEWWSDAVLIIARNNGSVSLLDAATCQSIMGSSPEWFEPYPAVTQPEAGQFLILECEVRKRRFRRARAQSGEEVGDAVPSDDNLLAEYDEDDQDDDDNEGNGERRHLDGLMSMASKTAYRAAHGLLWATGVGLKRLFAIDGGDNFNDNGPSSSKRCRFTASRDYRIVCFKRTSPAELFQWKLDSDEYGEALLLARNYGLDSDLVYQRQWQKSLMTRSAIDDFLVRISKRHWVLHECLHRVPRDLDSARDLLEFGLRATDVDCLTAIGEGEDHGRLVLTDANIYAEMNYTGERLTAEEERQRLKRNEEEYRSTRLAKVDWSHLRPEQRELIRARRQLLAHLHRLDCYEQVLGGRHRAPQRYKADEFADFRRQTPLGLAVFYARLGNYDAVDHVISHYTDELLPHRLLILSNAAECDSPRLYEFLLPSPGRRIGEANLLDWPRRIPSELANDWALRSAALSSVPPAGLGDEAQAELAALYAEAPASAAATNNADQLTAAQVSAWLADRARYIEAESLQVDNALSLLELGSERGFSGLADLLEEVRLLANIVYGGGSGGATDYIRLTDLRNLTELERCQLLIGRRESREDFLSDCAERLAPHLARLETRQSGLGRDLLRRLLLGLASEGRLGLVAAYVERPPVGAAAAQFLVDPQLLADVALEAAYTDPSSDAGDTTEAVVDLNAANRLAELATQLQPNQSALTERAKTLRQRVDACRLVMTRVSTSTSSSKSGSFTSAARCPSTLAALDASGAELLLQQVARHQVRVWCSETLANSGLIEHDKVTILLRDLDSLASGALASLVPVGRPVRVLLQCMLSAGQIGLIKTAVAQLELEPGRLPARRPHVPFTDAVDLLVAAAVDYFNSAASANDPTIKLARECLAFLPANEPIVRKELAMIDALVALEDLNIPVLPVGLRGHADLTGLLCNAVVKKAGLYKRLDDLIRVCRLLHLPNSAVASVQLSVAEAALNADDASFAANLCHLLIANNAPDQSQSLCPEAWRLCYALLHRWPNQRFNASPDDDGNDFRLRMARFCTVHCPPDMLDAACDLLDDVECCCFTEGNSGCGGESVEGSVDDSAGGEQISLTSLTRAGGALAKYGLKGVLKSAANSKRLLDSTLSKLGVDLARSRQSSKSTADKKTSAKSGSRIDFPLNKSFFYETMEDLTDESSVDSPFLMITTATLSNSAENRQLLDRALASLTEAEEGPVVESDSQNHLQQLRLLRRRLCQYSIDDDENIASQQLDQLLNNLALTRCQVSTLYAFASAVSVSSVDNVITQTIGDRFRSGPRLHSFELVALAYRILSRQHLLNSAAVSGTTKQVKKQQSIKEDWRKTPLNLIGRQLSPGRIYAVAKALLAKLPTDSSTDDNNLLIEEFHRCERLLNDCDLASRLADTCPSVCLDRFATDSHYRSDTVLGLAMTAEAKQLHLARALAARYEISDWEICATHMEYLFAESAQSVSLDQIRSSLEPLLPTLRSRPVEFQHRLLTGIYPNIAGVDLARLLYFYSLPPPDTVCSAGRTADWHCKTLTKLQSAATEGLDYRRLIGEGGVSNGDAILDEVLAPALTQRNVATLAKLAPCVGLKSGAVYARWISRLFWEDSVSNVNWLHRYEACSPHLPRLDPADYLGFIRNVAFGPRAGQVPSDARLEILRRAAKFCKQQAQQQQQQQQSSASRQKRQDSSSSAASAGTQPPLPNVSTDTWPTAVDKVSAWLKHSRSVIDRLLPLLSSSTGASDFSAMAAALGPDRSDAEQLINRLLIESAPLESVLAVAQCANMGAPDLAALFRSAISYRIRSAAEDADWIVSLSCLLDELREPEQPLTPALDDGPVLAALKDCLGGGGEPLSSDRRSSVLDFLANYFELSGVKLLPLLADHAIDCLTRLLSDCSEPTSASKLLQSEASRCQEFVRLMPECRSLEQVSGIGDLLSLWPPSDDPTNPTEDNYLTPAWLAWLDACKLLDQPGRDLIIARANQQQQQPVDEEVLQQRQLVWPEAVYNRAYKLCLASQDWNSACALACLWPKLIDSFLVECNSYQSRVQQLPSIRSDTLLALIDANLAGKLPGCCLYEQFINKLLSDNSANASNLVNRTIDQLKLAGCLPEAAWLMMEHRGGGCHYGLRTWDNAAALLRML